MKLWFLGIDKDIAALGDDEGRIYSVPYTGLIDLDVTEAVRWPTFRVRIPETLEKGADGEVKMKTRNLLLKRYIDPKLSINVICTFDPVGKVWYIYDGSLDDQVPSEGDLPEGSGFSSGEDTSLPPEWVNPDKDT